jgi:protein transport protein SEC23
MHSFNASPDESEYYKFAIMRENVENSLVMIQPSLMQYTLDSEVGMPVLLEIDSMKDDVILLLDTFFYVAIWKGKTVKDWETAGYAENPDYANFKALLEAPFEDAKAIMAERFPMARFYVSHPNDTNERKFKSRVNPGATPSTGEENATEYFTEDVSLNVFMQHLIKMAVQS